MQNVNVFENVYDQLLLNNARNNVNILWSIYVSTY